MHSLFTYLTTIPVNFWFWLLLVAAPLLVFSARPEDSARLRSGRLAFAVGATYGLLVLSVFTAYELNWRDINHFRDLHPECARDPKPIPNPNPHCEKEPRARMKGLHLVVYMGWIPATAYVGLWELAWRWRYRKAFAAMGGRFHGKWLRACNELAII